VIAFFLVFSFFIFFAIKPNLETGFKLQRELDELNQINTNYNSAIDTIISIQSKLENNRDAMPLLNAAIPEKPDLEKVIADIQKTASSSGLPINGLDVTQIPLSPDSNQKLKNFQVKFKSTSDFAAVQQFMAGFLSQRRLKLVNKVEISTEDKNSSESAQLDVAFEIESYYL
jgi:Tfp pilus assembly protein PilO